MKKKRIGILGGMGPRATLYFLDMFNKKINKRIKPKNDQDYPDITILMESSTPDRTKCILSGEPSAKKRINSDLNRLVKDNCEIVAIICVTAHSFVVFNRHKNKIIDFREILKTKFKSTKVKYNLGILTTDGSISSRIFSPLEGAFNLIYPDKASQEIVMQIIYELKKAKPDLLLCKDKTTNVLANLTRMGATIFIAGCTEIEYFVEEQNFAKQFLLPLSLIADEIISRYQHT